MKCSLLVVLALFATVVPAASAKQRILRDVRMMSSAAPPAAAVPPSPATVVAAPPAAAVPPSSATVAPSSKPTDGPLTAGLSTPKNVPAVHHSKEAGKGYLPGSPLYEVQEGKAATAKRALTEVFGGLNPLNTTVAEDIGIEEDSFSKHFWWGVEHPVQLLGAFLFELAVMCLLAFVYQKFAMTNKEKARPAVANSFREFTNGICETKGCCSDLVCASAWCCPALRIADTLGAPGIQIMGFWVVVILLTFLGFFNFFTAGFFGLCIFGICIYGRRQLRAKYNLDQGGATWAMDCLLWCCCTPCVIAQEARQVEEVKPKNATASVGKPAR